MGSRVQEVWGPDFLSWVLSWSKVQGPELIVNEYSLPDVFFFFFLHLSVTNFFIFLFLMLYYFVMQQKRDISYSWCSKKRKLGSEGVGDSSLLDINYNVCSQVNVEDSSERVIYKKKRTTEIIGVFRSVNESKTSSPNDTAPGLHHLFVLIIYWGGSWLTLVIIKHYFLIMSRVLACSY